MSEPFIAARKRSHRCGVLRPEHVDTAVVLMGWVQHRRDHGGCVFIDLRDRDGIVQVVFDPQVDAAAHAAAGALRGEWVVALEGRVRRRGAHDNPRLPTGSIEVAATRLEVLAEAATPPFQIEDGIDTAEEVRLKHRYLDLRRPTLQHNLRLRHRLNQLARRILDGHGFFELETPTLIRSTPEGARDYVVPSRVNPGSFFALPQSPQLFKQLLMVAGFDRYFQIARCFRDEDLRAERQPEFTQIDLEMSFCSAADVQAVVEELLATAWQELLGVAVPRPFPRLRYDDAMARFGSDAPDTRFGLELTELTELCHGVGFAVFADVAAAGGAVKGIRLAGLGELSRRELDALGELARVHGARGMAWARLRDDGSWQSPIGKFFTAAERAAITARLGLQVGEVAIFVADTAPVTDAALGQLRRHLGREHALYSADDAAFVWVTDFPMFEHDARSGRYVAAHHPFTAPRPEDATRLRSHPAAARAQAYDIVLNGVEIGGGSIRIHTEAMQREVFAALGIGEDEAREKFGFLLEALRYGAPPHGGLALGVDRIVMQMCRTASIRDVIAFPKTQRQTDLMCAAPAPLDATQLAELHIRTALPPRGG